MTLKLCGFSASNYYNQIKLQLMEKQVPFEEELVRTGSTDAAVLDRSPMGKVPFLDTGIGCISESMACAEYLEAQYPQHALLPADPFAAAKVRELVIYVELHLELVARELYAEAYFGGKVSDGVKERARRLLTRGAEAFARIAMFKPFVAGDQFTLADCAAIVHLPVVSGASQDHLRRRSAGGAAGEGLPQGHGRAPGRGQGQRRSQDRHRAPDGRGQRESAEGHRAGSGLAGLERAVLLQFAQVVADAARSRCRKSSTASAKAGCASQCALVVCTGSRARAILCSPCAPPSKRR